MISSLQIWTNCSWMLRSTLHPLLYSCRPAGPEARMIRLMGIEKEDGGSCVWIAKMWMVSPRTSNHKRLPERNVPTKSSQHSKQNRSNPLVSNTKVAAFIFWCAVLHHLGRTTTTPLVISLCRTDHWWNKNSESVWIPCWGTFLWVIGSGPKLAFSPLAISSLRRSYWPSNLVICSCKDLSDLGKTTQTFVLMVVKSDDCKNRWH